MFHSQGHRWEWLLVCAEISNMGLFQAFVEMKSSPPGEIVHPFLKDEEVCVHLHMEHHGDSESRV